MRLFIFFIIVIYKTCLFASEGTTSCSFLKFSESAKESSLSGSYSSYAGGAEMIFSNPAGLTTAKNGEFYFGFASYLGESKLILLSYKTSNGVVDIGFGAINFSIGSIERRENDAVGIVPSLGNFSSRDTALVISAAKKDFLTELVESLSAGLSLKLINSKIDNKSGYAVAMDGGFIYRYQPELNFSFSFSNLGTKIRYDNQADNLPFSIKIGAIYKVSNAINLISDIEHYVFDEKIYPSFGLEWYIRKSFVLRTGYKFGYDVSNLGSIVGIGFGFGVITDDININYAYNPYGELGSVNRFDIVFKF